MNCEAEQIDQGASAPRYARADTIEKAIAAVAFELQNLEVDDERYIENVRNIRLLRAIHEYVTDDAKIRGNDFAEGLEGC